MYTMATSFVAGGDIQSLSISGFDPTTLGGCFVWLDPSDASTVFTDRARTIPAVSTNIVNGILDKSGRANHVAATVASAGAGGVPATGATLIKDATSGLGYLQFGDMMGTATATTTGAQVFTANTSMNGSTISNIIQTLQTGINVSGPGIPANTTINSLGPPVTMSLAAGAGAGTGIITSTTTFTANLTGGTTAVTNVITATPNAIMVGMAVYHSRLVGNTFITAYNSAAQTMTLSIAPTGTTAGATVSAVMQFNGTTTNTSNQITSITPFIPIGTMLFSGANLPVNTYTTTALSGGSLTISTAATGATSGGTVTGATNLLSITTPRTAVIGQSIHGTGLGGLEGGTAIYYIKYFVSQSGGNSTVILTTSNDANTAVAPVTSTVSGQTIPINMGHATYPFLASPTTSSNSTHFLVAKQRTGIFLTMGSYTNGGFRELALSPAGGPNTLRIGLTNSREATVALPHAQQGQNVIVTGMFSEGIISGWNNGTPLTTTNVDSQPATSLFNTSGVGGNIGTRANTFPAVGLLGEYIQFNRTLQNDERQQVEGYLAWKWGMPQYLPTTHPYYYAKAPQTSFLPINAGNCSLWLDASDTSTFTQSVSQWTDKSGQGNHATQATAANQPAYSDNRVSFNGTSTILPLTTPNFIVNRNFTFFVVERRMSTKNFNLFLGGSGNATNSNLHVGYNNAHGANRPFVGFFSNDLTTGTSVGSTLGITRIFKFNLTPTGRSIVLDGTSNVSDSSSAKLVSYTGGSIGASSTLGYYQGDIFEVICYTSITGAAAPAATTAAQDQRVEGYLAWKWGLTGNLPATHPFKTTHPGVFDPSVDVPGCQLWLDAADPANVVRTVSEWRDKSGYGLHFTPTIPATPPSLTYGTYNSLQIANTTSTTAYIMSANATGTGSTTTANVTIGSTTYTGVSLTSGANTLVLSGAAVSTINQNDTITLNSGGETVTIPGGTVIAASSSGTTTVNQSMTTIPSQYMNATNTVSAPFGAIAVGTFNNRSVLEVIADNVNADNFRMSSFNTYNVSAGGSSNVVSSSFLGRASSARVLLGMTYDPFQSSGSRVTPYVNGTASAAGGAGGVLSYTNPLRLFGATSTIPGTYSFGYHEVIVIAQGMLPAVRQQLEGYLAWKWGLQSQLPANHPYTVANYFFNNTRPFVRNFVPTDIEGCQLWMDAADSQTVTLSGSVVTSVSDKSGLSNNLTTDSSTITYSTTLNTLPVLLFPSNGTVVGNTLTTASITRDPANFSAFYVCRYPSSGSYPIQAIAAAFSPAVVTTFTAASNLATTVLTVASTAGFVVGNNVVITGSNVAALNQTGLITAIASATSMSVQLANGSAPGTAATSGTVTQLRAEQFFGHDGTPYNVEYTNNNGGSNTVFFPFSQYPTTAPTALGGNTFLLSCVRQNGVYTMATNGVAYTFTGTATPFTSTGNPAMGTTTTAAYSIFGGVQGMEIGEVLLYNSAVTNREREQVEGYLAWKWGLQRATTSTNPRVASTGVQFPASTPVRHSYYNMPTYETTPMLPSLKMFKKTFDPSDLSPVLWYDPQDASTITTVNNRITNWTSKGSSTTALTVPGAGFVGPLLTRSGTGTSINQQYADFASTVVSSVSSVSVAAFNPATVYGAACAVWLDAADASTITGTTNVTQWNNKGSTGGNFTVPSGFRGPAYVTDSGRQGMQFFNTGTPATSSLMRSASNVTLTNTGGSISNIFVVASPTGTGDRYILSSGSLADVSLRVRAVTLDANDFFTGRAQERNGITRTVNTGTFEINEYTIVSGVFGHSANRSQPLQLSTDFTLTAGVSNRGITGFINEVIVINESMSVLQRNQISSYLGTKWNIPMTSPVNSGAVSEGNPSVSFSNPISSQIMTVTTAIPHNIPVGRQLFFDSTTGTYAAGGRSLATSIGPFIVASANVNTSTTLQLTMSTIEASHNVTTTTPIFLRVNAATFNGGTSATGLSGVYTPTGVSGQVITITIPTSPTGAMGVIDMTVRNNTGTSGYYLAQRGSTASTLNITPYSNQNIGTADNVNGIVEYGLVPFTSASFTYVSASLLRFTFRTYESHGLEFGDPSIELNLNYRTSISRTLNNSSVSGGTWNFINGAYALLAGTTDNSIVVDTVNPSSFTGIGTSGRLWVSSDNGTTFTRSSYRSLDNKPDGIQSYIIANVFNKCALENTSIGTILNQNVSTIVAATQFTHNASTRGLVNMFGASATGVSAGSTSTSYALRVGISGNIPRVDLSWNNTTPTSETYLNWVATGGNFGIISGVLNNVNTITAGSDVPALRVGASTNGWRYNVEFQNVAFQGIKTSTASSLAVQHIRFGTDTTTASSANVNSAFYDGGIGDFFVFNRILTLDERQLLEGWIAQKYRMQSGLGSNETVSTGATRRFIHPYRLNPTTIIPSNTLDLTSSISTYAQNLVAWFDAANAPSITFSSGVIVSGWSSTMGGLPVTLTPNGSAAPTLVQNAQNGLPGMRFAITGSDGTPLGTSTSTTAMSKFSTINTNNEYTIITVYKQPLQGGSRVISNILGASSDPRLAAYTGVFSYRTAGGTEQTKNYTANVSGRTYITVHYRRGNTLATRVNGALDSGSATTAANLAITGTNFGLHLGGYSRGSISASPFAGDIYEHIIFRSALTDQEIQHLEGYLAWKWGVRTDAPLSSTYLKSYLDAFGTLALWLDASTLTGAEGSAVSAWTNLSGTSVAQTGSSNLPTLALNRINSRNAVQFNGTSQFVQLNNIASLPTGNTPCTIFIVASTAAARTAGEGGPQVLFQYGGSSGPSGVGARQMYIGVNNTPANILLLADVQSAAARSSDTVAATQPFVMSATYDTSAGTGSTTNYTTNGWRNGTAFTTTGTTTLNHTTTGTQIGYLGMGLNNTAQAWFLNGFICEVVVYSGLLSTANRQLVESYLTWKWRAQGTNPGALELPASHPYCDIIP